MMDGMKLKRMLKDNGIEVSNSQLEKFELFLKELEEWNKRFNLTALKDENEVIIKHIYDSLLIISNANWQKEAKVIDVGTGAGFPGLPLKIMNEELEITLVDSTEKKKEFLEHIIKILKLDKATALHARAEELGQREEYREIYDIAVARAVAKLPVLLEYCLPLVKVGGIFIAYKGSKATEELASSVKALQELGGKVERMTELSLPEGQGKRVLIEIRKERQTDKKYPRRIGVATKRPL